MAGTDLGIIFSDQEIDAIISGSGTPPSIKDALQKGASFRRLKKDSIYSTFRWTTLAAAGGTVLAAGTYQLFTSGIGQAAQGYTPALTLAQTNLGQQGRSPFSGIFVARRLNINVWSSTADADNNQADESVDLVVQHSFCVVKKGTSFEWQVGPLFRAARFPGAKLYSVRTDATGYGLGQGYDLGVPFLIEPQESLRAEITVPAPAAHGLTLPAAYIVDVQLEFEGDAVELVSQ